MSLLRELLIETVRREASDLHLKSGAPPVVRVHGELQVCPHEPLSAETVTALIEEVMPAHTRDRFEREREADFSLAEEGVGRFRVNVFMSFGRPGLVLRHVKSEIPTFEQLNLPLQLKKLAATPRGIILASGTTGSGKSTTLAAMINQINQDRQCRIITIEDPIEYAFADRQSIISQREVGLDTASFNVALKAVLRQDPDVIMIGEMRDAESFTAALSAAETGHLVFSTVHTGSAGQTINRILDFFPAEEREQVRLSLADNLRAVFCQRLIPASRGGVVPAVEILINTSLVRKIMVKNALDKIEAAIETGREDGMQTFNQHIYQLIRGGVITEEQGLQRASNPEALRMNLRGIFLDEDKRILSV
ncbi:MAG: PilT/PilU family type 4a pilus ATPase [Candidatus Marinimicrobia bacterium]|nr:PilT/PilU family type 4a pilus ATPase [Candidatus Neomarinimicrobiota bacterium]